VKYEWKPPRYGTYLVFGHDECVMADLRNHGGTSNDGFQTVHMKDFCGPLGRKKGMIGNSLPNQQMPKHQKKTSTLMSNAFSALEEDNEKPMDDLVDDTRRKYTLLKNAVKEVEHGNAYSDISL
ncbi:hypothetical protein Tco_0283763, partial [Tanacetum coccineum]